MLIGLLWLLCLSIGKGYLEETQSEKVQWKIPDKIDKRDPKLLSMFTVIRFKNSECLTENGQNGTCYTSKQCLLGSPHAGLSGNCARGFGSCCYARLGCGGRSSLNRTYLTSPGYGDSFNYELDCRQIISIDSSICQLRLDIDDLQLYPPSTKGNCDEDYMTVNQDRKFNKICGTTINSHFYLDVDAAISTDIIFSFYTSVQNYNRKWNIKVSQITCRSPEEVPNGCGQYFTGVEGIIKGYNNEAEASKTHYLSGLNYAVCVRMELGHCSATYKSKYTPTWLPKCGDSWQLPDGSVTQAGASVRCANTMNTVGDGSITLNVATLQIFLLDTSTDLSNEHETAGVFIFDNYYFTYEQHLCT